MLTQGLYCASACAAGVQAPARPAGASTHHGNLGVANDAALSERQAIPPAVERRRVAQTGCCRQVCHVCRTSPNGLCINSRCRSQWRLPNLRTKGPAATDERKLSAGIRGVHMVDHDDPVDVQQNQEDFWAILNSFARATAGTDVELQFMTEHASTSSATTSSPTSKISGASAAWDRCGMRGCACATTSMPSAHTNPMTGRWSASASRHSPRCG